MFGPPQGEDSVTKKNCLEQKMSGRFLYCQVTKNILLQAEEFSGIFFPVFFQYCELAQIPAVSAQSLGNIRDLPKILSLLLCKVLVPHTNHLSTLCTKKRGKL